MCECPIFNGVKFSGDGYTHCEGKNFSLPIKTLSVKFLIEMIGGYT